MCHKKAAMVTNQKWFFPTMAKIWNGKKHPFFKCQQVFHLISKLPGFSISKFKDTSHLQIDDFYYFMFCYYRKKFFKDIFPFYWTLGTHCQPKKCFVLFFCNPDMYNHIFISTFQVRPNKWSWYCSQMTYSFFFG